MDDKIIIHDPFETELVSSSIEMHANGNDDTYEKFVNDISSMPQELVEKIFMRLYEEGIIKEMLRVTREVMEEYKDEL